VNATDYANKLREKFGELIAAPAEFRGEITLNVADAERIVEICAFAKKELGFDYLADVSSIDNYGEDPRWTIVYELYGIGNGTYIRLKTSVSEEKSELPTVTGVWRTADWHEREIYDMMGVRFRGHPDLRRIIMWEGYPTSRSGRISRLAASRRICRKLHLPRLRRLKAGRSSPRRAAKMQLSASRAPRLLKADFHG
jgi:NADH-quinone oxidoreductase subunit C